MFLSDFDWYNVYMQSLNEGIKTSLLRTSFHMKRLGMNFSKSLSKRTIKISLPLIE